MAGTTKQVRSGRAPIVDSAIANFTERGYHGTSMRDIAAGAGVTVASIYHHFASKQDVLVEIMAATMSDLVASTTAAAHAAPDTATDRLCAVVETWILFHTERRAEALIGASEIRSLEPAGRARVVGLRDEQEALFRSIIAAGVEAGEFGTAYPDEAARAVLRMGSAVASWYRADGDLSPRQLAERNRDLALGTVRAR